MAYRDFVPTGEASLVAFVENFVTRATALGSAIGLLPAQLTSFQGLVTAFTTSWNLTRNPRTRSGDLVILKNEQKAAMVASLRQLAKIVQAFPGTTDQQRAQLGITVPAQRQPVPVPGFAPKSDTRGVQGNIVTMRLHEDGSTRRRFPAGVKSAAVFSYVGENPPTSPTDWMWQGNTSRTEVRVGFDPSLPMGTKVFICAAWANERGQTGPASEPMGVVLLGTNASPTALNAGGNTMSLAA